MMDYNKEHCDREHAHMKVMIDRNERRLNNHSERIKGLENYQSSSEVKIQNLVDQIESLVKAIYSFIGTVLVILSGFFIWYVQGL